MIVRTALSASLFAALALASCSNGPDDALTGTWTNTSCFGSSGMPADIQSCSTAIEFAADLSVTLTDARQSQPATLTYPRCTTTRRVTGQHYSTSNNGGATRVVTITSGGTSTVERSGCANPDDNSGPVTDSTIAIPSGDMAYQLSADTLTIPSGPLAGNYSRSGR